MAPIHLAVTGGSIEFSVKLALTKRRTFFVYSCFFYLFSLFFSRCKPAFSLDLCDKREGHTAGSSFQERTREKLTREIR